MKTDKEPQPRKGTSKTRRNALKTLSGATLVAFGYGIARQYVSGSKPIGSPRNNIPEGYREASDRAWQDENRRRRELRNRFQQEIGKALNEAESRNRSALVDFEGGLVKSIDEALRGSDLAASAVANELSTMQNCGRLALLMAIDQVRGTEKAATFLQEKLKPATEVLLACHMECGQAEARFAEVTQASSNQFQAAIGEVIDRVPADEVPETWTRHYKEVMGSGVVAASDGAAEVSKQVVLGTVFTAIEVVLIRESLKAAGRALGKVVPRLATAAGISGGAIAVDGPLPLGDIVAILIALGCTVWTIYDIHKAKGKMRAEIAATLRSTLRNSVGESAQQSRSRAKTLLESHWQANSQLVARVVNGLEEEPRPTN